MTVPLGIQRCEFYRVNVNDLVLVVGAMQWECISANLASRRTCCRFLYAHSSEIHRNTEDVDKEVIFTATDPNGKTLLKNQEESLPTGVTGEEHHTASRERQANWLVVTLDKQKSKKC